MMSGHEVKAHIILLATIDGETRHHNSIATTFATHVNCLTVSGLIGIICLIDVRLTDRNIGINIGSVYPFAREILGQCTARLDKFGLNWC